MFAARSLTGTVLAIVAVLPLACSPKAPALEATYSLIATFPRARLSAEVAELEVGTPQAAPYLREGWSYRETDRGRGRPFRWAVGSQSQVSFFVVEPRAVVLVLEGRPLSRAGAALRAGPDTLTVKVNGRNAGSIELETMLAEYRLPLPETALRQGDNLLTLEYGYRRPTAAAPSNDRRNVTVAWYRIAFEGLHSPSSPPLAEPDGELLYIPFGSQVDYFLKLPPEGVLRADRWGFRGDSAGRLEVHIAADGAPERRLAAPTGDAGLAIPLELAPFEPVRLSLRAAAGSPDGARGGVLLARPSIWSTPADGPVEAKPARTPAAPPPRPNIIVYLVDTLRSDHLGCYGYPKPVSPRIDGFAGGATLFEHARAQSSWTLASVASIFTGLWPHSHGITRNRHRLAAEALTLPEILRAAGYATSAVVTNGYVTDAFGLDQGFDDLVLRHTESALVVHEEMVAWLEGRDRSRPFFLYLHTVEPHQPYLPPEEYRRRFAPDTEEVVSIIRRNRSKSHWEPTESNLRQLLALYDAEIAANDTAFGGTLDYLEQSGLLDDSLVIFVSDHGEAFHEHYTWNHGSNLFAEVLNVPLIIKMPGQRTGARVAETVQHVDLLPTLLDYLGLETPPNEGRSILELLGGGSSDPAFRRQPLFAQTSRFGPDTMSIIDGDWKYMERRDVKKGFKRFLYQWRDDPGELSSRLEDRPILAAALRAAIDEKVAAGQVYDREESVIDDELREGLRALGYLN